MNISRALDSEADQSVVVQAKPDEHLIVNAGPGTGKTYTLVERIKYLVNIHGLRPASEILVLSFSVAAVQEVKKRLNQAIESKECSVDVSYLDVRTFDSFASRLLRLAGTPDLRDRSYDERIHDATVLFQNGNLSGVVPKYRHIFIDEVQDLVSVRADLALQLLKFTNCGFTLLGDPAQGIYDFQLDSAISRTTSVEFISSVKKHFGIAADNVFEKNRRVEAGSELEKIAVKGRALVIGSTTEAYEYLVGEYSSLNERGNLRQPQIPPDKLHGGTCVLCRDNGQVLILAGALQKTAIPFRIQQSKRESHPPKWMGRVLRAYDRDRLNRADFHTLVSQRIGGNSSRIATLWQDFLACCSRPGQSFVHIEELRHALSDGTVFPDLQYDGISQDLLTLSTIHRSKGREFDNVILVFDKDGNKKKSGAKLELDLEGESKVMFVGMTRARRELTRMEPGWNDGIRKLRKQDRWIKSKRVNGFQQFLGIEVGLYGDIDANSFARGDLKNVMKVQDLLWEHTSPGMPVQLKFAGRIQGCPKYEIHADSNKLGCMSDSFGWALWHAIKDAQGRPPKKFPSVIERVWIRSVVTELGNLGDDKIDRSLRTTGLWLGVRIQGLGVCHTWV